MTNPREIIARARALRQTARPAAESRPVPAPAPASGPPPAPPIPSPTPTPAPQPGEAARPANTPAPAPARQTAPRSAGGHALYTELMRSHDRMGTRHLNRPD